MFGQVNILRRFFSRAVSTTVALVLSIGLAAGLPGCRCLSPKSEMPMPKPAEMPLESTTASKPAPLVLGAPTASNYRPPRFTETTVQPLTGDSNAFRPIVPDQLKTEQEPSPEKIRQSVSKPVPLPDASQIKFDELTRRVAELENALAESEEKARQAESAALEAARETAKKTAEILPEPVPAVATEVTQTPAKLPRKAPTLNVPGVTVSTEGETIRFNIMDKVLFVPGTYRFNPGGEDALRKIVAEIRAIDPQASLEIEGHTDSLNTDPANPMRKHDISTVKSVVVMEYFVKSLLWNHERIRTSAHGASRPAADNGTPEGRLKNNRVEIVVLP